MHKIPAPALGGTASDRNQATMECDVLASPHAQLHAVEPVQSERVSDSPASLPDAATPRSADTQTGAGHGRGHECGVGGLIDPSPDSVDTKRRD